MTTSARPDDAPDPADQMRHLRELVLGPHQRSVDELREALANQELDAEQLSDLLPEAVARSSAASPRFAKAMGPTFSAAFQESVKRDPQSLADAVSPIMGPAIRGYIQQQIKSMIQSLNKTLDHSLSPKGLGWRLEAWRTGKPFAEVVLLHTLVYRIEQVLVISPQSGMLMQSASSDHTDDDADLVSSLLTAIQDFMRDSFRHRSDTGSALQEIQTNELTVWVQHGPLAVLAVAIRGEPPVSMRQKVQTLLDRMHVEYRSLLQDFQGDTAPMELLRPDLEELLESEFVDQRAGKKAGAQVQPKQRKRLTPRQRWAAIALLALLAVTAIGYRRRVLFYRDLAERLDLPPTATLILKGDELQVNGAARQEWIDQAINRFEGIPQLRKLNLNHLTVSDKPWADFLTALKQASGITLTQSSRVGESYFVHGWRDPSAEDPEAIRERCGLPANQVTQHWDLIRSSDPWIVLRRLEARLSFPSTVYVHPDQSQGILTIHGTASANWIRELRQLAKLLEIERDLNLDQLQAE